MTLISTAFVMMLMTALGNTTIAAYVMVMVLLLARVTVLVTF